MTYDVSHVMQYYLENQDFTICKCFDDDVNVVVVVVVVVDEPLESNVSR